MNNIKQKRKEFLITWLNNAYQEEMATVETFNKQIDGCQDDAQLEKLFRTHSEVSSIHADRIKRLRDKLQ